MADREHRSKTLPVIWLLALSLIATTVACGSSPSARSADGSIPAATTTPAVTDDRISDAEMQDLESVAEQFGISLQAAIDRYAWNDNFAEAAASIRGAFPESYSGAEIVDADNAWIAFNGIVPREAREMVGRFNDVYPEVFVEMRGDLGYSEAELQKAIPAVHYAVLERPEVLDASSSHDRATGKITTVVVLEDSAPESTVDELSAIAEKSLIDATREDILDTIGISVIRSIHPVIGVDYDGTEREP